MRNNKKKPSVFKNILIITGCTMFAALYAITALYICGGVFDPVFYEKALDVFEHRYAQMPEPEETESLPAWIDKVEIEYGTETDSLEAHDFDVIGQQPRFDEESGALESKEDETNEETQEQQEAGEGDIKEPQTRIEQETQDAKDDKPQRNNVHIGNVQIGRAHV